jgi:hypothetical protein
VTLDKSSAEVQAQLKLRTEIRTLMKKLLVTSDPQEQLTLAVNLAKLEATRTDNQGNTFASSLGNQVYLAPVKIEENGQETITGRLIQSNVNNLEDVRLSAKELKTELKDAIDTELAKPENEQDPKKIEALKKQLTDLTPQLDGLVNTTSQAIAEHKVYLERFYNFYAFGRTE